MVGVPFIIPPTVEDETGSPHVPCFMLTISYSKLLSSSPHGLLSSSTA